MQANLILLAIVAFMLAGTFYAIYRVNFKLNNLSNCNDKSIKLLRQLEKHLVAVEGAQWTHYRQLESYQQLLYLLDLKGPIPALRGWPASPDLLIKVMAILSEKRPKQVLELGSGVSTLIISKWSPESKVVSIDHSEEFANQTANLLRIHGIDSVDLRVAPLVPHGSGSFWYSIDRFADVWEVDLLIIDGPPGNGCNATRLPAFAELYNRLADGATVVIDDTNRPEEAQLADAFVAACPNAKIEKCKNEKGTAVVYLAPGALDDRVT